MKYFIKDSDKEVQMGQTIEVEQKVTTSLGEGICKTQVVVTPENVGLLVKQGFLVQKEEEKGMSPASEEHWEKLKPYIRRFARKNDMPLVPAILFFASLEQMSPLAHIHVLLETISEVKNRGKSPAFAVYYLSPIFEFEVAMASSKVSKFTPVFYSKDDAMEAYELIKPFLAAIHE
jgi:hypothetical protein